MGERIVERPWSVVAADMVEFPANKSQYKHKVVFHDLFSRWVELKPLRSANGKSVAKAFEELILVRWETPELYITDNGKEFENRHIKAVLEECRVKHITKIPYHPQAKLVERSNRTLNTMILTSIDSDYRNWEIRDGMNTITQASTKVSPAFLNYVRHPKPVKSLQRSVEDPTSIVRIHPAFWVHRMKRFDGLRNMVAKFLNQERSKQAVYYNFGRRDVAFNI